MEVDPAIKERVVFCIGLVCGHLKSKAFADCFGWQVGIPPGQLEEIDFRVKLTGRSAVDYGVYMRGAGHESTRPTRNLLGSNWGHNLFRYPACDYCDDVFAETADIAVGDAWLPAYEKDPAGTSIIVVRNPDLGGIVDKAIASGQLCFIGSIPDQIAASQGGGLRDRREGLAYRLYLKKRRHEWVPNKRVEPNNKIITRQRARIYIVRTKTGAASHRCWKEAVERKDFRIFRRCMHPYIKMFQKVGRPLLRRVLNKLKWSISGNF